ncbi:MAG: GNAT family N-acetyltransferase, partial [Pseudomonadota bacterium]
ALRGQIESMHVAASLRGAGIGSAVLDWALEWFRAQGCAVVQLTSNQEREDAHRFYERHGFTKSHFGFKNWL